MHPALRKGPLFLQKKTIFYFFTKTPQFSSFYKKTIFHSYKNTPPIFHFFLQKTPAIFHFFTKAPFPISFPTYGPEYTSSTDLNGVGDVGIRFGTAGVIHEMVSCVQLHQRPFVVRYIVGQISINAHLV